MRHLPGPLLLSMPWLLWLGACGPALDAQDPPLGADQTPALAVERSDAACTDEQDNDGDGYLDCQDYGCRWRAVCAPARARVATFNVQSLGAVRSEPFQAALRIIQRIDADLVCFQEVEEEEGWRLVSLARSAGYAHHFMGEASNPMAGGLTNACLSRLPITEGGSFSSPELSSDPAAMETGRDIVAVRVELQAGSPRQLFVVNLHLKSGFQDSDRFRRQVEVRRAVQLIERHRQAHPTDAAVVLGDFNEEVDGAPLGRTFTWFPEGLPRSYHLGADLRFPIVYQPFDALAQAGLSMTTPTHEDSPDELGTRIPSRRRIDFVLQGGAEVLGAEVYEACADDGLDAPPEGDRLQKAGAPLPCGASEQASDHRPVLVDLEIW